MKENKEMYSSRQGDYDFASEMVKNEKEIENMEISIILLWEKVI